MANPGSLVEETVDIYNQFPYELLEDEWVKNQWENGFLNSSIEVTLTFDHDQLDNLLKEAINICHLWIKYLDRLNRDESLDSNLTLWSTLLDNNIEWKKLLALICMLTERSSSRGFSISDKITSLNASGLYFALLAIPGSKAFRIYHPNLFSLALSALRLPKAKTYSRKRGVSRGKSNPSKKSKQDNIDSQPRGKRREKSNSNNENFTPEESDDGSSDLQSDKLESGFDVEDIDYFVNVLNFIMKDFLYLIENFSLKDDKNSIEQIIQIMVEFVRLETDNSTFQFDKRIEDIHYRNKNNYSTVSFYAYKTLITLCNQLHGSDTQNIISVFKYIMPNILMVSAGGSQTIPHGIQVIKDHSTSFVCYIIKNFNKDTIRGARILLQQLCVQTIDKAEFRSKVSQAVTIILNCFPLESYAQMIEWFYKLIRHTKVNYRICALEIFSHLLSEQEKEVSSNLNSLKPILSHKNFVYAILSRCSDKAPSVRAKALTIVASHGQKIVTILCSREPEINDNPNTDDDEHHTSESDVCKQQEYDVKSVMEMLLRRIKDVKVNVRKTAVQVMEKIMCFDNPSVNEKYLQVIQEHCRDPAVLVRKQALHSLTVIFETYKDSDITQQFWMKGVLCQLFDAEASIQEKCLDMIDCILFQNLTLTSNNDVLQKEVAWKILNFIAYGKYQDFQRYLQKAIHLLIKKGKIKETMISNLKSHVGSSNDPAVWLLLASFAVYLNFHDTSFIINYWEECKENKKNICTPTLKRIIKVIGYLANSFCKEKLQIIKDDLEIQIKKFLCIPELISSSVETLCNIYIALYSKTTEDQLKIKSFSKEVILDCDTYLSSILLEKMQEINSSTEEQIIKRLFTLGELAQLSPNNVPSRVFLIIQSVVASGFNADTDPKVPDSQNTQSSQPNFIFPSQYNGVKMTPKVRAHAFIALGKLCLQNEDFAKKSIAALAKELVSSDDPIIRNNIVIIMADLSVRYTLLVDPYISTVTACLKDSSPFVRKQTLILLTQLLQEDYIKWKGNLFFRMLITLIDEDNEILNFARYSLGHLLLQRHPHMFFQNFVESVFFYNCYTAHSSYNKFSQRKEEIELFALNGCKNKDKRMMLYKFMLENMNDEDRFKLNLKLCQEILSAVPDIIPLNQESAGLLQDALAILCCDEIKLTSLTSSAQDEVDDGDVDAAIVAAAKKTIISHMVKKNVIENIVPIVIALKHIFEKVKSPLLKDLMLFLRELLKDYKNELKEIMAADKQLAKEIEFDLRRFEQNQEEEIQENVEEAGEKEEIVKEKAFQKAVEGSKTPQKTDSQQKNPEKDKTPANPIVSKRNCSEKIINSVRTAKRLVEEVAKRRNTIVLPTNQTEKFDSLQKRFYSELHIKLPVISLERIDKKVLELSNLTPRICLQKNILCQTPKGLNKVNAKPKTLFRITSTPSGETNKTLQAQNDISTICASPNATAQNINYNESTRIDLT